MWTLVTGYILSNIFENQTIKLFKNKFSNKQLSLIGIVLGWLFQEHQRKENSLVTGGKRFMLEREYRNQFLTQILKIIINIFIYPYFITSLELITLLSLFVIIFLRLFIKQLPLINKFFSKIINNNNSNTIFTCILYKFLKYSNKTNIFLFISIFILFNNGFLKLYSWFDIFYLFQPIIIITFICFTFFCFFWLCYLIYIYITNKISKNLAFLVNILTKKIFIYFSILSAFFQLIVLEINIQNLNTENFFKEIIFKIFLFFC